MVISNSQIHIAGTTIPGKGRPLINNASFEKNEYPKIGSDNTTKGFSLNADKRFPCNNWCKARREPYPGQ